MQGPIGAKVSKLLPLVHCLSLNWISRAETSLKIFDGIKPSDLLIVTNQEVELGLNLHLAEKLGIEFSSELLDNAKIII